MLEIVATSNRLVLRRTQEKDVEFVLRAENDSTNSPFVGQWTRDEHINTFSNDDILHLIIESKFENIPVGFAIITGLKNPNRSILLKRIVVTSKGKGFGSDSIKLIKEFSFKQLNAHRLWLDVKEHNLRAYNLYKSEGFIKEGISRESILNDGKFESVIVMSILEEEYRNMQKS